MEELSRRLGVCSLDRSERRRSHVLHDVAAACDLLFSLNENLGDKEFAVVYMTRDEVDGSQTQPTLVGMAATRADGLHLADLKTCNQVDTEAATCSNPTACISGEVD